MWRWYLAGPAGLSSVPAAVCAAVACKGRAPAQQDVEDDPEAPQVAALVVEGSLVREHLHHLRCHVLRRAALGEPRSSLISASCICTESGGASGYRRGELRGRYGGAGAAQLHSAAQVKVTDLNWGDLVEAEWRRALAMKSHIGSSEALK